MIYEERYKIDFQDTCHHTSLRVTKPNGEVGIIAHFGGDYWYGTGCFEGYTQEYLKAFYRDFANDYNRVVDEKNKCIKHEHHARGCLSIVMVLAFFLATLLAVSAISCIAQDLTITQITTQITTKIHDIWYLYAVPLAGIIISLIRFRVHKKRLKDSEVKLEEVSKECNLQL
ncbi:membrane protein [Escherichia phage bumzen]|uniref:Membrane protein n=1 Tax=Escherichia phage bumzen TaxID=2696388 RepID=A0A6B9XC85_9CAUD|nr:membrane protein [Escherichia phage bumzen]